MAWDIVSICLWVTVEYGRSNALEGTWNSLGQDLSDEKLFDALDKLAASNIKISNLIIDDNWQSVDHCGDGPASRRWLGFETDPQFFPRGLKGTVEHIRGKHPHIKDIAVWHALFGTASRTGFLHKNPSELSRHAYLHYVKVTGVASPLKGKSRGIIRPLRSTVVISLGRATARTVP